MNGEDNHRILIVDDNEAIHRDFQNILTQHTSQIVSELNDLEAELFGEDDMNDNENDVQFELDSAFQGQEALARVELAVAENNPFALIFMDVRMPPGWDGIETIAQIWKNHPNIEMVICTAYSDYSHEEIINKLGITDNLLFLRKPFDAIEVKQMALTLTKKWSESQRLQGSMHHLEAQIDARTKELKLAHDNAIYANEAKSNFTMNLSYQLRTSLNVITGYTNLLEDSIGETCQAEISSINKASKHLQTITQDIITLCRLDLNQISLHYEVVQLRSLFDDVLPNILLYREAEKNVVIVIDPSAENVCVDIKLLWYILDGILRHAELWLNQGQIKISAETGINGLQVIIEVPSSKLSNYQLESLFADYTSTPNGKETSLSMLDLLICQRYCHLMKGTLEIKNYPNDEGVMTVISVSLPQKQ